jgi:hypothetical protein
MPDGISPEVNVVIHQSTREGWLLALIDIWRPYFVRLGNPLPAKIWVSMSDLRPTTLGKCYPAIRSDDGNPHIYVSSLLGTAGAGGLPDHSRIGCTVCHEGCHAALDCEGGHGREFKRLATAFGLVGKMKATIAGPMFIDMMEGIVRERLGPLPHAPLRPRIAKKGSNTRLLRVQCPQCGYLTRTTKMWLDVAVPACPNPGCDAQGETMTVQWRTKPHETPPPFKPDFET